MEELSQTDFYSNIDIWLSCEAGTNEAFKWVIFLKWNNFDHINIDRGGLSEMSPGGHL